MLDKESSRIISTFFLSNAQREPDFIFPATMFDPAWRLENNMPTPLWSNIGSQKDMPGAYAFFEPCNQNNKIEIMYVGRSKTLRVRLGGHWRSGTGGTEPVIKWFDYCWQNDYPFCPYVAVFICWENIRELENLLKHFLKPRFNIH
jgi:hypothetical protein